MVKKEMTKSHFNMWRLLVSAVHADGRVSGEELKMVEHYLKELNFDEKQLQILRNELRQPASLDDILPAITDPADRSQSAYFVRLLLWKDQKLTDSEEAFLKKVQDHFKQFLNMDEIEKKIQLIQEVAESQDTLLDTPALRLWRKISNRFKA